MSLQTKTLLFTLVAMAGLVAALYFGAAKVLLQGFARIEARSLERQTDLVKDSFAIDRDALRTLAREISSSTDLSRFVGNPSQPLAGTGLSRAKLEDENLDFLALVSPKGDLVLSQTSAAVTSEARQFLPHIRRSLRPGSPLLRHRTVDAIYVETIALPSLDRPMFFVSAPIVSSSLEGPVRGSLVLARLFSETNMASLERIGLSFTLYPLAGPMSPENRTVAASLGEAQPGDTLERAQSNARMSAFTLLAGELGTTPFLLEVSIPRRIYAQALESRRTLLLVVVLVCTLFVALASYLMHRFILSRLHLLRQGLDRIAQEGSAAQRLEIAGSDEFARLASDTNRMLGALEAAQREAQESAERYALVAEGVNDGIWDLDAATEEMYCSLRLWHMLGYAEVGEAGRLRDHKIRDHIHPDDLPRVDLGFQRYLEGTVPLLELEFRVRALNAPYRWMLLRGAAQYDAAGRLLRIAGSLTDLTRRGLFDELTGLPNRLLLREQISHALSSELAHDKLSALLLVNVNRFKVVNDSLGRHYGDTFLIEVAKRLQAVLRPTDTVARLSGDEFAVLLEGLADSGALADRVKNLSAVTSAPFLLEGHTITTSLSIGVVADLRRYSLVDDALRDADNAMHHAKEARAPFAYFDQAMLENAKARLQLEADLRQALERGELSLAYQPIVSLADGSLYGVEALLRWQHPGRGAVSPAVFVPLAEEMGLIGELGEWVLRQACEQVGCLNGSFSVSVNLSSRQFNDALVSSVGQILHGTGLPPQRLVLEVTESALMNDSVLATDILRRIRALGVRTALDDFGTGYSSLSYLSDLPLNILKIDSTFTARLLTDSKSIAIVQAVVGMSQVMALKLVAEGVETEEQVELLKMLGCHFAQGYYYYRPLPLASLRDLVEQGF